MSTKKKTSIKKAAASVKKAVVTKKAAPLKKAASIVKQNVIGKKTAPKKAVSKKVTSKKAAPKKAPSASRKPAIKPFEDAVTKEALKLVDKVSLMLRNTIKTSHKTTEKARTATHKQAHTLLGKATRHLDDAIKSSNSVLSKIINKI